jgi:hypothetical protein
MSVSVGVAGCTESGIVAERASLTAVIVTCPVERPVTCPWKSTVATLVSLLVHHVVRLGSSIPLAA